VWSSRLIAIAVAAAPLPTAAETHLFDFADGPGAWSYVTDDPQSHDYEPARYTGDGAPAPCLGIEGDGHAGRLYGIAHSFSASGGSTVELEWTYRAMATDPSDAVLGVMVATPQGTVIYSGQISPSQGITNWYRASVANPITVPGNFSLFFYLVDQAGDLNQAFQVDEISVTVTPGPGTPPDPGPGPVDPPEDPVLPPGGAPEEPLTIPQSEPFAETTRPRPSRNVVAPEGTGCGNNAGIYSLLPLILFIGRAARRGRARR
jgi:hypothetical protein